MLRPVGLTSLLFLFLCCATTAQDEKTDVTAKDDKGFVFEMDQNHACTPVKNQARTGTCWSFATTSFLESELLRMGKDAVDLSEMFVVRHTYPRKAQRFVRMHGKSNLGPGSLGQDLLHVFREVGAVPEEVYGGMLSGEKRHNHGEMDAVLAGMLDAIVANRGGFLSDAWDDAVEGVLDAYLGEVPTEFTHGGRTYTPRTFADSLGLDPDRYVELTSYSHQPLYRQVAVEVPDNWAGNLSWNVKLDELMEVMDHALASGFTVAWDGDVSERGFFGKKGVAVLPAKPMAERTAKERGTIGKVPEPELEVTQEVRQRQFDRYESTDDHLMHVVGTSHDQNGTRYYYTKNSHGTADSERGGFIHMSEAYVRAKTVTILVHEDALPEGIAARLRRR